ncbi:hypothetical protein LCGC14_0830640 [marine sediment metagenome]|uniref:site-specific DNA-methyltransferase (adenine-specific) n=1 Tax=marine sediment metagenome TaxID=412755 RepID=A0A0F9PKU4_9ZZZZ
MAENIRLLDSQIILEIFGLNSDIYAESVKFFKEKIKVSENYEKFFKEWKEIFEKIYGKKMFLDFFINHTYFAQILKILLITKLGTISSLNFEEIYKDYITINLKDLKLLEFDYYSWTHFSKDLFKVIYTKIGNTKCTKEDLFSNLYQQIFISDVRHKIGEFFTPSTLVQRMVDDIYIFGLKILDPSCGSGNFLVSIMNKIIDSSKSLQLKYKAILNVYGFDINPLAIITTKINIFLLLLEYFNIEKSLLPNLNIFLIDSLFPESYEKNTNINIKNLYNSFDLVIGNPPWLTYKDLYNKDYQIKIRELSGKLEIKPLSQFITHIELAAVFFYAIPLKFLKLNGIIFFAMPKSVLNGDHCYKFRAFSIFNKNLEIWDFPNYYFFNVNHICLKAEYIGKVKKISINDKFPIKTKIFNNNLELIEETIYSSLKIHENGAKLILPHHEASMIDKLKKSSYKNKFFQGATLVPRSLIFFQIEEKINGNFLISSDSDVSARAKKEWEYSFQNIEIERKFQFKTFLNKDLIPFFLKRKRNVFLPVNEQFDLDLKFLQKHPNALAFYKDINGFYQNHKKKTSNINTLFANLNFWNKLKKQENNKSFIIVYNASGSNLKAAVINNQIQKIIIGSENYYYSTNSENEAYYLSAILNSPSLSRNIKLIKSSRHIHKRPFMFPIPIYNKSNITHKKLAKKGKKYQTITQDLFLNNPKITSEKVRIIIHYKLLKIQKLIEEIIFL